MNAAVVLGIMSLWSHEYNMHLDNSSQLFVLDDGDLCEMMVHS